jgi:hypothetical protein
MSHLAHKAFKDFEPSQEENVKINSILDSWEIFKSLG